MAGVPGRVGDKALQPRAREGDGLGHVGEQAAMSRDHERGRQRFDQVDRLAEFVERVVAFELGKHHAKAALPQRIGRDQDALSRIEQDHRMGIVAGRGVHLPQAVAEPDVGAGLQQGVVRERGAALARGRVGERLGVPVAHMPRQTGRNGGPERRPGRLQRGVAAAVVAVQVGVDQQVQRPLAQRRPHQRDGLRRVRGIAAVHQRGGVRALDQDVVGRQPAAFQNRDVGRERVHRARHPASIAVRAHIVARAV